MKWPAPSTPAHEGGAYLTYTYREKPIVSVPVADRALVLRALQTLIPMSPRRAIYQQYLLLSVSTLGPGGLGRRSNYALPFAPDFPFNEFIDAVNRGPSESKPYPVVSFPSDIGRKRFYVTLLSGDGSPMMFVKASLDPSSFERLASEAELVGCMRREATTLFHVPRVINQGSFRGAHYVAFEALPSGTRPLGGGWSGLPECITSYFREQTLNRAFVWDLPWWEDFVRVRQSVPSLYRFIGEHSGKQIDTSFAHGDFHSRNIFVHNEHAWLIDWEDASSAAPVLTDRVRFYLGERTRALTRRPARVLAQLLRRCGVPSRKPKYYDLSLAIAYLCSRGNGAGLVCGSNWSKGIGELR